MASKVLQFDWLSGETLTGNVYPRIGGAALNVSPLSFTESGTTPGLYQATMTDLVAGSGLRVQILSGGVAVGNYKVDLVEAVGNYDICDGPTAGEIAAKEMILTSDYDRAKDAASDAELTAAKDEIIAAVESGGAGTGANAVTITVRDGSAVAIQNASVSAWSGSSLIGTGVTNASGIAVLSLDNATYTINITANGFNGSAGNSLVVSGATAHTYTLTALSITPSDPPLVTGYLITRVAGVATGGISISVQMMKPAAGETGSAYVGNPIEVESDGSGLATFTDLSAGATYSIRINDDGIEWDGTFVAEDSTFEIKSFVG